MATVRLNVTIDFDSEDLLGTPELVRDYLKSIPSLDLVHVRRAIVEFTVNSATILPKEEF